MYEESENTDECTREQIARAILAVDPDCTESVARNAANSSCVIGSDKTPIKVAIKNLSRGILRGSYTLRSGGQQRPFGSQRLSALQGRNSTMHSKTSFSSRNSSIVPGSGANKPGKTSINIFHLQEDMISMYEQNITGLKLLMMRNYFNCHASSMCASIG